MKRDAMTVNAEEEPIAPLSTFSPVSGSAEGQLLVREARAYISEVPEPKEGESRPESKRRFKGCTGERLFKEELRRYRLIAAMLCEQVSIRQICRTCLCDRETVQSVERREAESTPAVKRKLTRGYGRLARMTLERLEEEVLKMNHQSLAITAGIATDKFQTLTGDVNLRIEHTVAAPGENIFERMTRLRDDLMKVVKARVIEPSVPALPEQ